MKLQLNFQIVRFLNYKQRFSDSLPQTHRVLQAFQAALRLLQVLRVLPSHPTSTHFLKEKAKFNRFLKWNENYFVNLCSNH